MIHCFLPSWRAEYGCTRQQWKKLSGLQRSRLIANFRNECNADWLAFRLQLETHEVREGCLSEKPPFPPDYESELVRDLKLPRDDGPF